MRYVQSDADLVLCSQKPLILNLEEQYEQRGVFTESAAAAAPEGADPGTACRNSWGQRADRFPDRALLYIHAGDAMRELKHYEEAFRYWEDALSLNSEFLDAAFSMAFCHEELGQYRQAHKVWTDLAKELNRRGLPVEAKFPKKQAENCWKRMT